MRNLKVGSLMDIIVEKCGIRMNYPAFIIIYRLRGKVRRKIMPLRNFKASSNVEFVANDLKQRHRLYGVPLVKIEKMLRLLQELLNGVDKQEAVKKIEKEFELKLNEDLNKLSTHEIELQKQLMDSLFVKNQIKKDDEDFVYDKQVDFTGEKEDSNWDLENDDENENFWDQT